MTRIIVIATKAEYDALANEDKNFITSNQPIAVGDTILLQFSQENPAIELEYATICTYVTTGHPIAKGYQALTLKKKE